MASTVFLSSAYEDHRGVDALGQALRGAGIDVVADDDLHTSGSGWPQILAGVRQAGVVIVGLSDAAMRAPTCRMVLDYAIALRRPVLLVQVGPIRRDPAGPFAGHNLVVFYAHDAMSAPVVLVEFDRAAARGGPPPDPQPREPPLQQAHLDAVRRRIGAGVLDPDTQHAIVRGLEAVLDREPDQTTVASIRALLRTLADQPWATPDVRSSIRRALTRGPDQGYGQQGYGQQGYGGPPVPPPTVGRSGAGRTALPDEDVQFTVYRPRGVRPHSRSDLLVFAHLSTPFVGPRGEVIDPERLVREQAASALGPNLAQYGRVVGDSGASLPRGDELMVVPWLDEARFNPPRAFLRWEEPVHRIDFRFQVGDVAVGRHLHGGVDVYLGVVLISVVPFTVRVGVAAPAALALPAEPSTAAVYRNIFASYSHDDDAIVRRIRDVVEATGDRYLMDVTDLRAGELWQPRIAQMITEADVFQLFWSDRSMRSPYVRTEWEYAMSLRRERFVRPVYWQDPLPNDHALGLPPSELTALHFGRLHTIQEAPPRPPVAGTRPPPAPSRPPHDRSSPTFSTPPPAPSPEPDTGSWAPTPLSPGPAGRSRLRRPAVSAVVVAVVVLVVAAVLVALALGWI